MTGYDTTSYLVIAWSSLVIVSAVHAELVEA